MTYQHVVVMSVRPRPDGSPYPERQPLPEVITDISIPPIEKKADGEAVLEVSPLLTASPLSANITQTYTVDYNRNGLPFRGYIIGRMKSNGHRFLANHADENTLKQLCSTSKEPIGRSGWVRNDSISGTNLFSFESEWRL